MRQLAVLTILLICGESASAPVPQTKLTRDSFVGKWNCVIGRWEGIVIFERDGHYQMYQELKTGEPDRIYVVGKFWVEGNTMTMTRVQVEHKHGDHIEEDDLRVFWNINSYPNLEGKADYGLKVLLKRNK